MTFVLAADLFANATNLNLLTAPVSASNVGTTTEVGEPTHYQAGSGNSVWFSYVAPYSGTLTVDLSATSGLDVVVAVYTGSSVSALTLISDSLWSSPLAVSVVAGTTYHVAVASLVDGVTGQFELSWRMSGLTDGNPYFVDPYLTSQLGDNYESAQAVQPGALFDRDKYAIARTGLAGLSEDRYGPVFNADVRLLLSDGSYFTFNDVDDHGVAWVITDVDGWWTLPEPEIPDIKRGFADGSYDVRGRYSSRVFTLRGSALVDNPSKAPAARSRLMRAFNLVRTGAWFIADEDEYKRSSYVRLGSTPTADIVNRRGRIDFEIPLRAADPVKYEWVDPNDPQYDNADGFGQRLVTLSTLDTESLREYNKTFDKTYSVAGTSTSSGEAEIVNSGDYDVYVSFLVRGPLSGPAVITNVTTDQTVEINAPVPPSVYVLSSSQYFINVDSKDREVHIGETINGLDVRSPGPARGYLAPLTDWIYLVPGVNRIFFDDQGRTTAGPVLEIRWRSGWAA